MAQKTIIQLVDDIDNTPLEDGEGETVTFGLDGTTYEIDLSTANAEKLRGVFQDYIAKARKVKGGKVKPKPQSGPSAAEIRDWAKDQGMGVPDRGRIPAEVREAFDKAS